jgi:hypothetical protein
LSWARRILSLRGDSSGTARMIKETSLCAACGSDTSDVSKYFFRDNAARASFAAGREDYNSILSFAAGNVNGSDVLVCNSAERTSVHKHGPKGKELTAWSEHPKRYEFCALVLAQSALR